MSDDMSENESDEGHGDEDESNKNYETGEDGQNVGGGFDFNNDQVVIKLDEIILSCDVK